jgi:hypothetical protein
MAGTLLCEEHNIFLYNPSGRVKDFNQVKHESPMLWCHESIAETLIKSLF